MKDKFCDDSSRLRPWERRLTRAEQRAVRQQYRFARSDLMHVVELEPCFPEPEILVPTTIPFDASNGREEYRLPREYWEWDEIIEHATPAQGMPGS
jgi:hypothetical protein